MHWGKHQTRHQHVTCTNTNSPKPEEVTSQARTHAHTYTYTHTHTHTHTHTRMHEISNVEVFTAVETTSIKPCSLRCSCAGQGTSPREKTTVCLKCILNWTNFPSKHARLDPEAFLLWPLTASVQSESAWIIYIYIYVRSNFLHPLQFRFSKEGKDQIVQNWPRSNLDGLVRVWPNTSGLEANWCAGIIGPGFWQNATGPWPFSHFQTWFYSATDILVNTVQNQPGSDLVLTDCVRFWPNGSSLEASRCARIIWPTSGQCFQADPDQMQIGSGMFTGFALRM